MGSKLKYYNEFIGLNEGESFSVECKDGQTPKQCTHNLYAYARNFMVSGNSGFRFKVTPTETGAMLTRLSAKPAVQIELTDMQVRFLKMACEAKDAILPLHPSALSDEIFAADYGFTKQEIETEIENLKRKL